MNMNDIKLFAINEKELKTLKQNKNRQLGYLNGIWHTQMCHAHNE